MNRRSAFTLIELLVVASMFVMLLSLIVVGRRGAMSHIRDAARALSSELVRAQARALNSDLGAGVIIDPDAGETAGVIAEALPRYPIRGQGRLLIGSATTGALVLPPTLYNADNSELADGYRIQFWRGDVLGAIRLPAARPSPWFRFSPDGRIAMRPDAGQTANNTIWPDDSANALHDFAVLRYPARLVNQTTLPPKAAIDLRFSGCGSDPYAAFGSLRSAGAIAITFDPVGQIDLIVRDVFAASNLRNEIEPDADLYFLLAPRDAISSGSSLASPEALWVVVQPSSGRVVTAANVPQVVDEQLLTAVNEDQRNQIRAALRSARAKALAGANMR
jgi:type II secretory pathway pseudopilin PulG